MAEQPNLAVCNANVLTMEPFGQQKANAVAVKKNRFLMIGEWEEIRRLISKHTNVIDAKGGTLLPGFIDNHVHVTHYARYRTWGNCEACDSIASLVELLRDKASNTPIGQWVLGYNYHHRNLQEKRHPSCVELDNVSQTHPVGIVHSSGHFWAFNSKGLTLLKIPDNDGSSTIFRDQYAKLTGILADDAINKYVYPVLGLHKQEGLVESYEASCRDFNKLGITSLFHAEVDSREEVLAWQSLRSRGGLTVRVNLMITEGLHDQLIATGIRSGFGDEWLRVGPLKIWADGSVMGCTAALRAPYAIAPSYCGELRTPAARIKDLVVRAHKEGYQLTAHVMGDRAVLEMAEAYELALSKFFNPDHRHRLEHCSLADEAIMKRLAQLKVLISIQPSIVQKHIYGSVADVVDVIGLERAHLLNDFGGMMRSGLIVSAGSDAPSGTLDPIVGLDCAVNRSFEPKALSKRVSVEQGLKMFTYNAAFASFEEHLKGSIAPGKLADFVILSRDIMSIHPKELLSAKVLMTVVNGKIVYSAQGC